MKIKPFIDYCNSLPPELIWLALLVFSFSAILVMLRMFGASGLYIFIAIAITAANVQVFKAVKFSVFDMPVPLGTILYASAYLCTDILNEFYGAKAARKSIYMGFMAMLLMSVFMLLTLAFRPLSPAEAANGMEWALESHNHIFAVFSSTPVLFIAGMAAYLCSQLNDVWMYSFFKKLTAGRFLWLRNNGAAAISAFIDDAIFSILAWVVLAEEPVEWGVVWGTYILGTYALRLVVAILDTPVIYLAKYFRGDFVYEKKQPLLKRRFFVSFKKLLQSN
jgi:uncharacterized integral membrane protein (TIGR00697 family)